MKGKLQFERIGEENSGEWDSFLLAQEYNNPFQSGELLRCLGAMKTYEPKGILARENEEDVVVGGFVAYKMVEKEGIVSRFATRTVMNGGPIIKKGYEKFLPEMIRKIIDISRKDSVYTEIWNMTPQDHLKEFFLPNFEYIPWLNFFIKLDQDKDTVFRRISKSTRKHIRRAEKTVDIIRVKTDAQFDVFYQCLEETYGNVGVPLISRKIFHQVFKSGPGIFLLAVLDDTPIASRVVLPFGKEIYDWYAGTRLEMRSHYPNELLVWWVLKYGLDNGFEWFNFGGAGQPGVPYGPREFKRRFGGEQVEYGRYRHVNSKLKNLVTQQGIKLYPRLHRKKQGP